MTDHPDVAPDPVARAAVVQRWETLTFLHWRYPPETVQAILLPGLEVEVFDGSAARLGPGCPRALVPASDVGDLPGRRVGGGLGSAGAGRSAAGQLRRKGVGQGRACHPDLKGEINTDNCGRGAGSGPRRPRSRNCQRPPQQRVTPTGPPPTQGSRSRRIRHVAGPNPGGRIDLLPELTTSPSPRRSSRSK